MKADDYVKPFGKYSHLWAFFVMPFHPKSFHSVWQLLLTAWKSFVCIQNKRKFNLTKTKIVSVDHPLDKKIPFVPENVKIYLDFVNFFCRIMRMFVKKTGIKKGMLLNIRIIDFIKSLYSNASKVYLYALSTTKRPFYLKKPKFFIIHFFDPHLLCVPSLHVAIVIGVWAKVRELLKESNFNEKDGEEILNEIYYGSIAITESVLYVKQHSINCVAGALYMLTAAYGNDFFSEEDCKKTIANFFKNADDIEEKSKNEILGYIEAMYNNLCDINKKSQREWQNALQLWLDDYKSID